MPSQPLRIRGEVVEEVEDYKYLGVVIDNRLDWKSNMEAVVQEGDEQTLFPEEAEILQPDTSKEEDTSSPPHTTHDEITAAQSLRNHILVELNDFRPVALTSHVMKTMERLLVHHLRPQTHHALDPLQFAYREKTGVEDAIIFLLHRSLSHLDRGSGAVRITFLDFSSAFNTIQPLLLRDKLTEMGVGSHLVAWITDYLTGRPQYVRLWGLQV
ncbi:hypothetical protein L3Q82_007056 [Scortum barcoo]|uniref:Uncharacterized protein n=1 Tax=Scortum barcoo TaxID=214431 RepID=A0ACB8WWJ9_9TELE|nr:hypothetical protein L3Q82_007056 [Scortum barcoo]